MCLENILIWKNISHYKILEKLGGGGMGEVYKARDIKLRRTVALKFLPAYFSRDEEAKQRFIHEAQNASSLDHPNICTIYEIDEIKDLKHNIPGRLFIAMAFYEGETLKNKIRRGSMSPDNAIDIAIQVARGLAKAHQKSIIHRDIKPENVMITCDGIAKIVDFGIARLAGRAELTGPGVTMGTLSYTSPEQIRGRKIDHRTDMWSFGVMLYEMLTGELPFRGEIDQAVIYSILNEAPESLRTTIPEQLVKVIYKTLEKNPPDRYSNMEEVIDALKGIENGKEYVHMKKPKTSIAVLPFKNMSDDASQEYFCDGISEEIINSLTAVQELRVIARTSSFSFKKKDLDIREIGRKLNVEMILEGSVRKTGNRLRITAQLINVSDGSHIWSEKFDRTLEDILIIQDEISLLLVQKLKIELMEDEKNKMREHGTDNLEAYNLYLLGKFYAIKNSKADIEKGIEYFKKAVEKDNNFLIVYFWLVSSYSALTGYYRSVDEKIITDAREVVESIMKIDPDSTPAHLALSSFHMNFTHNWEIAGTELLKVRQREPDNPSIHHQLSVYYFYLADFENAIHEEILAQRNDPLQIECILRLGICYLRARKADEARKQFSMVIELAPDLYFGYWMLGQAHVLNSDFERGIELLNKALKLSNEDEWVLADLVRAYALGGNKKAADLVLESLKRRDEEEHLHPYTFVTPYCALDRLDEAFEWMEKSLKEHDPTFVHLFGAEGLDNLRRDPRFLELIKKYGFDKYYKTVREANNFRNE
jgi:serine/threonine protein kinase/Tfp pilus assembly protein PilF